MRYKNEIGSNESKHKDWVFPDGAKTQDHTNN